MKRHDERAQTLRLRLERDSAIERERLALAHRDSMQRELEQISRRLEQRINRNNELWNAAKNLPGAIEAFRGLSWTA